MRLRSLLNYFYKQDFGCTRFNMQSIWNPNIPFDDDFMAISADVKKQMHHKKTIVPELLKAYPMMKKMEDDNFKAYVIYPECMPIEVDTIQKFYQKKGEVFGYTSK